MVMELTITNRKKVEYTVLVDDIDADLLKIRWHTDDNNNTVYVRRNLYHQKPGSIPMHRVILERILGRKLEHRELVDHRDMNGLNNTRSNLRLATPKQNKANTKALRTNTSGVKGVRIQAGKWRAQIHVDGRNRHIGMYETIEEAITAYREAAVKYHGEFARLE